MLFKYIGKFTCAHVCFSWIRVVTVPCLKATRVPGKPRGIVDSLLDIQDEEVARGIELVLTDEVIKAQILETAATGQDSLYLSLILLWIFEWTFLFVSGVVVNSQTGCVCILIKSYIVWSQENKII